MIRIDSIWLATEPMDMRSGMEKALARVVSVFGAAQPHCAYLFANRRASRMKVLVHDGLGMSIPCNWMGESAQYPNYSRRVGQTLTSRRSLSAHRRRRATETIALNAGILKMCLLAAYYHSKLWQVCTL